MRDLNWNGYFNSRDLGGLPTPLSTTGSTVFQRVARGPRREMLTDSGWAEARQWGLSTVVDLRCMHEVGGREGDPVIDKYSLSSLVIVNAPTEDQDNPEFREVCPNTGDTTGEYSPIWSVKHCKLSPTLKRGCSSIAGQAAIAPG